MLYTCPGCLIPKLADYGIYVRVLAKTITKMSSSLLGLEIYNAVCDGAKEGVDQYESLPSLSPHDQFKVALFNHRHMLRLPELHTYLCLLWYV